MQLPKFASLFDVRAPLIHLPLFLLQPHGPTHALLQRIASQFVALDVADICVETDAHNPKSTSDAVVRPPEIHRFFLRLQPHEPLQSLLHCIDSHGTSADVGSTLDDAVVVWHSPRFASLAVVRPPSMHAPRLRLQPQPPPTQLLLQRTDEHGTI